MLQEKMREVEEFPQEHSDKLPNGFQELSKKKILKLRPEVEDYAQVIAQKVAELYPRSKSIWLRSGQIKGKFRKPTGLEHLWGEESPEVINKEHGIRYKFDFTKIMFAKGNVYERQLLPKRIPKGQVIVDMFAGIGYFTLGLAKKTKPEIIYSIEWNETAFKYLKENIKLNKVSNRVQPIFGDCKEIVKKLADDGVKADFVIMGLLPAPVDAIEPALNLAKKEGTVFVYEGVEEDDSTRLFDEFSEIAAKKDFDCKLIDRRLVKSFAPHRYHVVLEIQTKKN